MNILVAGGSGKLAKYICQEFADHSLLLADVAPPPADRANVPFKQTDVTSFEQCQAAVAECQPEVILALGAIPYPTDRAGSKPGPRPDGQPAPPFDTTMKVNIMGLYYLMMAAAEAKVKAVIQTSSIVAVESDGTSYPYLPVDDNYPLCPKNSYNYSKIAGELMMKWFTKTYGIQTICMRPAWNWTPEFSQQWAQKVKPITEWSSWLWHYVDTRDVAWAHRLAFDALDRLPEHDAFIVHAPDHQGMEDSREIVEKFRPDLLKQVPVYLKGRQAFYSCAKAHDAIGYRGRYSWTDYLWK
jgi:nucleoside-diphosphate-sugar epimerase